MKFLLSSFLLILCISLFFFWLQSTMSMDHPNESSLGVGRLLSDILHSKHLSKNPWLASVASASFWRHFLASFLTRFSEAWVIYWLQKPLQLYGFQSSTRSSEVTLSEALNSHPILPMLHGGFWILCGHWEQKAFAGINKQSLNWYIASKDLQPRIRPLQLPSLLPHTVPCWVHCCGGTCLRSWVYCC